MKKPNTCKGQICYSACIYHKSSENYPYHICTYFDSEEQEDIRYGHEDWEIDPTDRTK